MRRFQIPSPNPNTLKMITHRLLGSLTLIFLLPISTSANSQLDCRDVASRLRSEDERLAHINRNKEELALKFDDYVKQDFDAQTEGIFDTIHRNAALKVIFAKKSLEKSLEQQKAVLRQTIEEFCTKCGFLANQTEERPGYCERCPAVTSCTPEKS